MLKIAKMDNSTGPAKNVIVTSAPPAIIVAAGESSTPFDTVGWNCQLANSFTESSGILTSIDFSADKRMRMG